MIDFLLYILFPEINVNILLQALEVLVIGLASYFAWRVGKKQNEINQNIIELQHAPSIIAHYYKTEEGARLNVQNSGISVLNYIGCQINDTPVLKQPSIISANASINVWIDVEAQALSVTPHVVQVKVFLSNLIEQRYIFSYKISIEGENERRKFLTHPIGIQKEKK